MHHALVGTDQTLSVIPGLYDPLVYPPTPTWLKYCENGDVVILYRKYGRVWLVNDAGNSICSTVKLNDDPWHCSIGGNIIAVQNNRVLYGVNSYYGRWEDGAVKVSSRYYYSQGESTVNGDGTRVYYTKYHNKLSYFDTASCGDVHTDTQLKVLAACRTVVYGWDPQDRLLMLDTRCSHPDNLDLHMPMPIAIRQMDDVLVIQQDNTEYIQSTLLYDLRNRAGYEIDVVDNHLVSHFYI